MWLLLKGQYRRDAIRFLLTIPAKVVPRAKARPSSYSTMLRHLGGFGLFLIAIVDSSPIPTFGGTDILTAILSARHVQPWYYYATVATVGSVIGAYLTFRAGRLAGADYLRKKFGRRRVSKLLAYFEEWGTGCLALSTAVPLPSPTSAFFAAAGVLNYSPRRFVLVVSACRAARYSLIAVIAFHYGRHFIRVLRHPAQYYGWFLAILFAAAAMVVAGIVIRRRLQLAN